MCIFGGDVEEGLNGRELTSSCVQCHCYSMLRPLPSPFSSSTLFLLLLSGPGVEGRNPSPEFAQEMQVSCCHESYLNDV